MEPTRTVVFVCLHGAAKSVIAARYLQRLAEQRGLNVHATAAGIDPDPGVPPPVVKALLAEGIDVRGHRPRRVTHEELARAWREERLAKSPSSSASAPTHPDRQTG